MRRNRAKELKSIHHDGNTTPYNKLEFLSTNKGQNRQQEQVNKLMMPRSKQGVK